MSKYAFFLALWEFTFALCRPFSFVQEQSQSQQVFRIARLHGSSQNEMRSMLESLKVGLHISCLLAINAVYEPGRLGGDR